MTTPSTAARVIDAALGDMELQFERLDDNTFVVALPGEKRLKTACWLTVGAHALEIEAFVMRKPDENREQVYAFLLQRNVRMYAVSWAIDASGDVVRTTTEQLTLRWSLRSEMRLLFELASLDVIAEYGDFSGGPPAYGREQVWVLGHAAD